MCGQTVGRIATSCDTAARDGLLFQEKSFGHEFQERGCCVASSKWLELVWLGKTETSICEETTTACASSSRSCCDVKDPCDAARDLQCDPELANIPLLLKEAVDFFMMGAPLCCTSVMVQSDSHQD